MIKTFLTGLSFSHCFSKRFFRNFSLILSLIVLVVKLPAQVLSLTDRMINGTITDETYQPHEPEYQLSQMYQGNFQIEITSESDTNPLNQLAAAMKYSRQGDFPKSDSYWASINSDQNKFPPLLSTIKRLEYAAHLVRQNFLNLADTLYLNLWPLIRDQTGHNPLKARYFEQRGLLQYLAGKYESAEEFFTTAEKLWAKTPVNYHIWKVDFINHQGMLSTALGEYKQADEWFNKGLRLIEQSRNKNLYSIADIYSNLGSLRRIIGDYPESLRFYKMAEEIYINNKMYVEQATLLNNMALVYDLSDSLDLAINLYKQSLNIYRESLGTNDLGYATILNNLAGIYDYLEQYDTAEEKYLESLNIFNKVLGTENIRYSTLLNNLALLYENTGKPEKAEELYHEALQINQKIIGVRHPEYVSLLYNIAGLYSYYAPAKSLPFFREANEKQIDLLRYYYSSFNEDSRLDLIEEIKPEFEKYYSTALQNISPPLAREIVDFSLQTKGLATRFSIDHRVAIQSANPQTQEIFWHWQDLRDSLAKALVLNEKEREMQNISLDQLMFDVDQLEKDWTRNLDKSNPETVNFQTLKNQLAASEIAIEFIHFEWHNLGQWSDTIYYYALLIDPNLSDPIAVRIGWENQLQQCLQYGNYISSNSPEKEVLNRLIVDPLAPFLKNKKTIHLCPSGILHRVSFASLTMGKKFLVDKFNLHIYSDWHDLNQDQSTENSRNQKSLLIGGLDYTLQESNDNQRQAFPALPGSQREINNIRRTLITYGRKPLLLEHQSATRSHILEVLNQNQYEIIHFATHGYSFRQMDNQTEASESLRNTIITADNPLIRSGLALSGINDAWYHEEAGQESGILSAFDIAHLNLHYTALAILSSCQSGTGSIHPDEGVFGLPRALKLAGVNRVIYTLWKIDDEVSANFLSDFYETYLKHGKIDKAFRKTQLRMRKRLDSFYWAGFVLIN